jgi:hypothetical protein
MRREIRRKKRREDNDECAHIFHGLFKGPDPSILVHFLQAIKCPLKTSAPGVKSAGRALTE